MTPEDSALLPYLIIYGAITIVGFTISAYIVRGFCVWVAMNIDTPISLKLWDNIVIGKCDRNSVIDLSYSHEKMERALRKAKAEIESIKGPTSTEVNRTYAWILEGLQP